MKFIAQHYYPEDIQEEFDNFRETPEESDFESEQEIVDAATEEITVLLSELWDVKRCLHKGGYFDVIENYLEVVEGNGYTVQKFIYDELAELKQKAA